MIFVTFALTPPWWKRTPSSSPIFNDFARVTAFPSAVVATA